MQKQVTHKTAPDYCPKCKKTVNRATSVEGETESFKENDINICLYCGSINRFDSNLRLERAPQEFLFILKKEHPETWATIVKAKKFILKENDKSRNT